VIDGENLVIISMNNNNYKIMEMPTNDCPPPGGKHPPIGGMTIARI
jgi:hypothetical protein